MHVSHELQDVISKFELPSYTCDLNMGGNFFLVDTIASPSSQMTISIKKEDPKSELAACRMRYALGRPYHFPVPNSVTSCEPSTANLRTLQLYLQGPNSID